MSQTNRIENVRQIVDCILHRCEEEPHKRLGFVHLYGVSLLAGIIAKNRNTDPELALVAGMLHDISTFKLGVHRDHQQKSSVIAEEILRRTNEFTEDEIKCICTAVASHGRKESTDDKLSEIIKDADVLHHFYYNPYRSPIEQENRRRSTIEKDLGLSNQ